MAETQYTDHPKRGYPKSVFFDDGEHGLEVERMSCLEADGSVSWDFNFTILGNHATLSDENAKELIAWLNLRLAEQQQPEAKAK